MFDSLMEYARKNTKNGLTYVFLDEIQGLTQGAFSQEILRSRLSVRFVCSGSASSPISRRAGKASGAHQRPSYPFIFIQGICSLPQPSGSRDGRCPEKVRRTGESVMGMFAKHPEYAELEEVVIEQMSPEFRQGIDSYLSRYLLEGGFPEVWSLPDWETSRPTFLTTRWKRSYPKTWS